MFFNINKDINNQSNYKEQYFSYNEMTHMLQDTKEIKIKLKNYLKKNKYIKYADNGEDYIYLFPNSKFFKKFKELQSQEDIVKDTLKDFLITELDFDSSTDAVEFIDIEIEEYADSKSIIKITFI